MLFSLGSTCRASPISRPAGTIGLRRRRSSICSACRSIAPPRSFHGLRPELDPLQLSLRMQVWRIAFRICVKAMLDGSLEREAARERGRQRAHEELARNLSAAKDANGPA
jgi:hypothetical protein